MRDFPAQARDAGGGERLGGRGRLGGGHRGAGRRHDPLGDPEEIAVRAPVLPGSLRRGHPAELLHAAPRPTRAVSKAPEGARHGLAQALHQPREDPDRIPEERAVRGEMDVGLHHGGVDAEGGAVLQTEPDRGLDHRVVERPDRRGGQAAEGAVEGVVLRPEGGIEGREAPQGVAVGDALAQFTEIPRLHPLEHEGAEDPGGAQAVAPCLGAAQPADQIMVDERDELSLRVQEVSQGLQGRV